MRIRFIISVGFVCTVSGIDKMTVPLSVNKKILFLYNFGKAGT